MRTLVAWIATIVYVALVATLVLFADGCTPGAAGILRGAQTVLDAVCETRAAFPVLRQARDELAEGDVHAARDLLKAYLLEAKDDPEVSALLSLIETQLPRLP